MHSLISVVFLKMHCLPFIAPSDPLRQFTLAVSHNQFTKWLFRQLVRNRHSHLGQVARTGCTVKSTKPPSVELQGCWVEKHKSCSDSSNMAALTPSRPSARAKAEHSHTFITTQTYYRLSTETHHLPFERPGASPAAFLQLLQAANSGHEYSRRYWSTSGSNSRHTSHCDVKKKESHHCRCLETHLTLPLMVLFLLRGGFNKKWPPSNKSLQRDLTSIFQKIFTLWNVTCCFNIKIYCEWLP